MYGMCSSGASSTTMITAAEWLRNAPRGAYTTARTVKRSNVFDLSFHIQRLAESATLMSQQPGAPPAPPEFRNIAQLRPLVLDSLTSAIRCLPEDNPTPSGELKLTILAHWEDGVPHIDAHAAPLPPRPLAPVKVKVKGEPRQTAAAKDSEWVRERLALEESKPSDVNEILLAAADGAIMEGMTSNFFAVIDGKLCTAGDGILLGTVRDLVIKQCHAHGVEVRLHPPRIQDIETWEGCLISSTSRLALPVDEIVVDGSLLHTGSGAVHNFSNDSGVAFQIDKWVSSAIESSSEPL